MEIQFNELTIRISNGNSLVSDGKLEAINRLLIDIGIPRSRILWCLYNDYLVFGIHTGAENGDYIEFVNQGERSSFDDFIERLNNLLEDFEVTIWMMYGNKMISEYNTYFSNYGTAKVIWKDSKIEYEFGDYK